MGVPDLPRYARASEVPRDLRPADELTQRGYRDLGPARATLLRGGRELPLYSTSEARRRRDGMWPRTQGVASAPGRGADLVERLAERSVPAPGRAVGGRCQACGQDATALVGGLCPSCRRSRRETALRSSAAAWLEGLFTDDFLVLDTETTGLGRNDEIIELGVVDAAGATLLETLVWPHAERVPAGATRVHGLSVDDLRGAPTWPEVLPELQVLAAGRRVLAWNAPFDERMARQTSRLWRLRTGLPAFECAMRAYAVAAGVAGGHRKLELAAAEQGVLEGPQRHRSSDDARLTLAVLRTLAGRAV